MAALIVLCAFGFLTISVDEGKIRWYFGPGLWRKELDIAKVTSIEQVRNKWYFGAGIRNYGKGMLYNVGGQDAIELKTTEGSYIRLGSDETKSLMRAIQGHIN